ncbi:MAG: hypothetical protein KBH07_09175 [Flavobacteriales bacterium]|nr:hypothetical protein [Flavobacteriales bacterium]MBP9080630.1 hypothetical protein [Flavobacteriales bacterium]
MKLKATIQAMGLMALAACLPTVAQAQFEEGDNVLGVGVGIGGGYGIGFSGTGVTQTPALGVHLDHGMGELGPGTWGLGGAIGYKSLSYKADVPYWGYAYDYSWTYLTIGVRGTWHYNEWHGMDKLDTYGGLMLAYRSANYKDNTVYPNGWSGAKYSWSGSGVGFSGILGARYYFTDNIGAFLEAGFGYAVLQVGLAAKF